MTIYVVKVMTWEGRHETYDPFTTLMAIATFALLLAWAPVWPLDVPTASKDATAQRSITPRGELAADERATINLFERSRNSVVFITTKQAVVDF